MLQVSSQTNETPQPAEDSSLMLLLCTRHWPSPGVAIFIHTCSYISVAMIKYTGQDNRQKEAVILANGFQRDGVGDGKAGAQAGMAAVAHAYTPNHKPKAESKGGALSSPGLDPVTH